MTKTAKHKKSLGKKDKVIMKNHEDALKRLDELQGQMVGGEKASKTQLRGRW